MSEICRICLSSNSLNDLISPCNCKGSQQYVHESCLDNWLETVMDNVLTSPSGKNAGNIFRCNVCYASITWGRTWFDIAVNDIGCMNALDRFEHLVSCMHTCKKFIKYWVLTTNQSTTTTTTTTSITTA